MAKYIKAEDVYNALIRVVNRVQGYTFDAPKKTRELIGSYITREFHKLDTIEMGDQSFTYKDIAVGCGFRLNGVDYIKMRFSTWTGGLKIPECEFVVMTDNTQVEMIDVHFDVKPWDKEHWMDG